MPAMMTPQLSHHDSNFAGMARSYRIIALNLMAVTLKLGNERNNDERRLLFLPKRLQASFRPLPVFLHQRLQLFAQRLS